MDTHKKSNYRDKKKNIYNKKKGIRTRLMSSRYIEKKKMEKKNKEKKITHSDFDLLFTIMWW